VLPSLTPAAQSIARLILDDPGLVVRSTITEFSGVSGTSEATIVRTARALGFGGYSQMRFALAAAVAKEPERLVPGDLGPDDPLTDVIAKVARAESEAIADTAAQLDPDQLGEVVTAIVGARRVDVYGVAASGLVATDMAQKLLRIGLSIHPFSDAHLALTSAALLKGGDVVVAISCSGETPDVLVPARTAAESCCWRRLGLVFWVTIVGDSLKWLPQSTQTKISLFHCTVLCPHGLTVKVYIRNNDTNFQLN
jgi:DNA-binding MurR/RpiR family transcriptional regulator